MSFRTNSTRPFRSAPLSSRRLASPSRLFARGFIKPTNAVMSAEDEQKHRAAYKKRRVEVEPKMASVDESFTLEAPTVRSALDVGSRLELMELTGRNGAKTTQNTERTTSVRSPRCP